MTRLAQLHVRRDLPPRRSGFLLLALSLACLSGPARAATHYQLLKSFGSPEGMGVSPQAPLILGSDGAFYGTTYAGGSLGLGTLFRLFPPQTPEILSVGHTASSAQIDLAGTTGFQYQVQRSTDPLTWSVVDSLTMPPSGNYSVLDTQAPGSRAFYRAVWLPSAPSPRNAFEPMQTAHRNTNLKPYPR